MAITESILSIVLAEAEKRDATRVKTVKIEVGELTNIVGDCVKFYFELMSKDTLASGAEVEIAEVPLQAKCPLCGKVKRVENLDFICECGTGMKIIAGKELAISAIEIE
ncbi:hydrogenase maturation nickel metallochaperone HypA [Candidatus Oleimmundimicrobium sp.]|uniref:hydrogenase maturation nickel metallochaperone HypA/HybF n=1 Tax=Candidatus Oleimmundimicrobium sp. TaxID=3060597 RepID=UPI002722D87C|nr:hydrogenase maturation nickel metallochaperone HypA [Candidatus Oleimmundimicrobium sp.]MDO8886321.1 hydrogenase maturation nickel metallochaperone HypA [Candidatus Oleimmundimicrobium sp.]